ncbi:MAG: calcium-binding protein [Hyphomicrobiales bacterium]
MKALLRYSLLGALAGAAVGVTLLQTAFAFWTTGVATTNVTVTAGTWDSTPPPGPTIPAECGDPDGYKHTIFVDDTSPYRVDGTNQDDLIVVTGAAGHEIHAGNGKDCIAGGPGNDTIYGDNAKDIILGGGGDDTIYGENGQDSIWGGDGADTCYGGHAPDQQWDCEIDGGASRKFGLASIEVPATGGEHTPAPELVPTLRCIEPTSDGGYVAHLGYTWAGAEPIDVAPGTPGNAFSGSGDWGQPGHFLPGTHDALNVAVTDGAAITWTLRAPAATAHSVTVDSASPRCAND